MSRPVRFRVVEPEDGTMLYHLVARRLPGVSQGEAKALVKGGAVYVGHLRVRLPTLRVATGERVTVYPDALAKQELAPELVRVVYRDPELVVLDKPPGVPVAQTRDSARGTLAEALRRRLEQEGVLRPYVGVVHRLDQGASGLVLMTVRSVANASMHRLFLEHRIERRYRVRVVGDPPAALRCDAPLVELSHGRVRVARAGEPRARSATTLLRRVEPVQREIDGRPSALLDVTLETGRTHQIRVHAQALGFPVLGDRKYGQGDEASDDGERDHAREDVPPSANQGPSDSPDEPSRLYLHADRLRFAHPRTGELVDLRAPLPDWARAHEDD